MSWYFRDDVAVIIASMDTPLTTQACIRTLFQNHAAKEVNLTVILVCPGFEWARRLVSGAPPYLQGRILMVETPRQLSHAEAIEVGLEYVSTRHGLFMTVDSDVLFGADIIANMCDAMCENDIFVVGVDECDTPVKCCELTHPVHWANHCYLTSRRVHPYCALWRKTDTLMKAVKSVGFHFAMRAGTGESGEYYDTAGLLCEVMRVAGWRDVSIQSNGRILHLGGVSWQNREAELKPILLDILSKSVLQENR